MNSSVKDPDAREKEAGEKTEQEATKPASSSKGDPFVREDDAFSPPCSTYDDDDDAGGRNADPRPCPAAIMDAAAAVISGHSFFEISHLGPGSKSYRYRSSPNFSATRTNNGPQLFSFLEGTPLGSTQQLANDNSPSL